MINIKKINAYLPNNTHFQFYTEFHGLVIKAGAENLGIAPMFAAWLPLYDREDAALKKIVKSAITRQIQDADKARDAIYSGIVATNSAALKHFSADVRGAAERLKIVFDTYGNIARKPRNDETSAIYNILQELNGKYAPDAAIVGITAWVAELETRNNAFAALMRERFDETAGQTDIVLKDARAEVDAAYMAIRERINALVVVNGTQAYENFIRTLNAVIDKYNAVLNARRGRKHNKPETQETASAEESKETETPQDGEDVENF